MRWIQILANVIVLGTEIVPINWQLVVVGMRTERRGGSGLSYTTAAAASVIASLFWMTFLNQTS